MCGIAGVYLKPSTEDVERMLNKLIHRGTDGQGIKNLPNGTLGHRRLAILDGEYGHQPMGLEDTWITFDGTIYNYRELASEYLKGQFLRTCRDTEIILHLYKQLGPRFVKLLDGRFAFVILERNGLFMARDPLGVKPCTVGNVMVLFILRQKLKQWPK
jgi:asparagine synthase (glutamine-hydrolysing)